MNCKPYFTGIDLAPTAREREGAPFEFLPDLVSPRIGAAVTRWVLAMPLYFFRIRNGNYSGASDLGTECADHDAAWKELTKACSDIASGISRKLQPNSEWQMEMLDESRQPVFRIRIVSESFD